MAPKWQKDTRPASVWKILIAMRVNTTFYSYLSPNCEDVFKSDTVYKYKRRYLNKSTIVSTTQY